MKKLTSLLIVFCFSTFLSAQNITFNLVQAPCNNNGVLDINFNGVSIGSSCFIEIQSTLLTLTATSASFTYTLTNYGGGSVYAYYGNNWNFYNGQPPINYTINTNSPACPALGTATVTVTNGTGPFAIDWFDANNTFINSGTTISNLTPGVYFLMITDANGCMYGSNYGGDTARIFNTSNIYAYITSGNASCSNGSLTINNTVGGNAPYTYLWQNGTVGNVLTGLTTGTYSVTITDAIGCSKTQSAFVGQSPAISINRTISPATCLQNNGAITAFGGGGVAPYTYLWSDGQTTQIASNLSQGNYSVIATDANGCTGTNTFYLTSTSPVQTTYTTTPSPCNASIGSISLTITGGVPPYTVNWNTFPAQTGNSATGLSPGNYSFNITDINGCTRSGAATINPTVPLIGSATSTNSMCVFNTGTASINIASGSAPYSYSWNTGATTATITGLDQGYYTCVITDNLGCTITKYAVVSSTSPITIGFTTTPVTCLFATDGIATAIPVGGAAPYSFSWSNGSTNASITNVPQGGYAVTITDANGCVKTSYVTVANSNSTNSCYCVLEGNVFEDVNNNCFQDAGEQGIPNIMIQCSTMGYRYTDANGHYSFIVPSGNYTLSQIVQPFYPLAACQQNAIPTAVFAQTNCTQSINFANTIVPIHDMSIYTTYYSTPPIVGNVYQQQTIVKNNGTIPEPAIEITTRHDGQLNLNGFTPYLFALNSLSDPNWYGLNSIIPTINPGATNAILMNYIVPTNIPIGTIVSKRDTVAYTSPTVTNWLNDYTPWNNVYIYNAAVVGSYDPNEKEVTPKGAGSQGLISQNDSSLTYTIHFQNTGNYFAQNIVLLDTLDTDLRITSMEPIYGSHPFTTEISTSGVVKFKFNNIHLPPQAWGEEPSKGMVMYKIHLKPNLPNATQIKNTAHIYFDYNAPITTNTTLNTIDINANVSSIKTIENDLLLFPNPSSNALFYLTSKTIKISEVQVYSITGELLLHQKTNKTVTSIDLSAYSKGLYFIRIKDVEGNYYTKKALIQ